MSELINRIGATIKDRGLTFNKVERDCSLGNGTIKRWAEQSPRLDKLVVVAEYLGVSLDYLVSGVLCSESSPNGENGPMCDGIPLSQMEADMVAMFRLLPEAARKEVFDLVHFKYTRLEDGEKESIYSTYLDASSDEESGPVTGHRAQSGTA